MCLPRDVRDVEFKDVIKLLKTAVDDYKRYIFGKRSRKRDEKIADFEVDLKRLSATCKFEAFMDQALCMQFVVGLNMPNVQSRLMQESTLAFQAAVKIAIAESSAATSCANIERNKKNRLGRGSQPPRYRP